MAEVKQREPKANERARSKKLGLSIDMTPMVDLAFLLLTFFMLASSFLKPNVMELVMPERNAEPHPVNEALTLLIGPGSHLTYYIDTHQDQVQKLSFSTTGLRNMLFDYKGSHPKGTVIIKADDKANYGKVVQVLDEMNITGMQRYALVDITESESDILRDNY